MDNLVWGRSERLGKVSDAMANEDPTFSSSMKILPEKMANINLCRVPHLLYDLKAENLKGARKGSNCQLQRANTVYLVMIAARLILNDGMMEASRANLMVSITDCLIKLDIDGISC